MPVLPWSRGRHPAATVTARAEAATRVHCPTRSPSPSASPHSGNSRVDHSNLFTARKSIVCPVLYSVVYRSRPIFTTQALSSAPTSDFKADSFLPSTSHSLAVLVTHHQSSGTSSSAATSSSSNSFTLLPGGSTTVYSPTSPFIPIMHSLAKFYPRDWSGNRWR